MSASELKMKLCEPLKIWGDCFIYYNKKNTISFFKFHRSTIEEIEIEKLNIDLAKDSLTIDYLERIKNNRSEEIQ